MTCPLFGDLGKISRDLISKNYNLGQIKAESETSHKDITFKTNVTRHSENNALSSFVDLKFRIPQYGALLGYKFTTEGKFGANLTFEDKPVDGLKVELGSDCSTMTKKRLGHVKAEYRQKNFSIASEVKVEENIKNPFLTNSFVYGFRNYYLGYSLGLNAEKLRDLCRAQHRFSAVADVGDFSFQVYSFDLASIGTTIYQRVNRNLELAFGSVYARTCPAGFGSYPACKPSDAALASFDVAVKYRLDDKTVLRSKINAASQFVLAISHAISPGLRLSFSGAVNLKDVCDGNHKMGIGLEYKNV